MVILKKGLIFMYGLLDGVLEFIAFGMEKIFGRSMMEYYLCLIVVLVMIVVFRGYVFQYYTSLFSPITHVLNCLSPIQ